MKTLQILTLFFFVCTLSVNAQSNLRNQILQGISTEAEGQTSELHRPLTLISDNQRGLSDLKVTDNAILLAIEQKIHQDLKEGESEFQMEMPISSSETVLINLTKVSVVSEDFKLVLSSADEELIDLNAGLHYWGKVVGDPNSLVTINVYEGEMSGVISFDDQLLTLTKLDGDSEIHTIYSESELELDHSIGCMTDDVEHFKGNLRENHSHGRSAADANNCVHVYLEVANDIYKDKGGTQGTTNYMTGLFNQVIALYAAENVNMTLGKMKLWNTNDPYTGSASSQMNTFKNRLDGDFDGDIAHLVSYGNGGIAYVDVLGCNFRQYAVGYSGINSSYSNVPSFSWSVNVLTHEIGHNLGSQHTHACVWNGNNTQIDDCGSVYGAVEGSCYKSNNKKLPSSGTIMSYCHLIQNIGIRFSNGFGTQPGNLIRNRVHNGNCLTSCGGTPPTENLELTLSKTNISCGETADGTATANPSGGGGSYTYKWNNGKTTKKITGLSAGTWRVTVSDGSSSVSKSIGVTEPAASSCACTDQVVAPGKRIASRKGVRVVKRVDLPAGTRDVSFILRRVEKTDTYHEQVVITYRDGQGTTRAVGTYRGNGGKIFIAGEVQQVTFALKNVGPTMTTGTIRVVYTSLVGCVPSANVSAPLVNSNENLPAFSDLSVQIYPNPASDLFQIEMSHIPESGRLYMFDGLGTLVYNQEFEQRDRLPIDASHLVRGTYFIRLETESSEPITKRVVIN